ncbi:MAG: stress response translation initiation inhibitor YciH [Proteobacteria bacterium]|nr:MAG: stress response translation initiation inhibitor YciH [Pseudomonadota bacterium]
MNNNARLVYSSDPAANEKCPKCKELKAACVCVADAPVSGKITAVLRIEKQGRGGKTVTVLDRLPKNEAFLKDLTTELKKKCGAGGTHRIEEFGLVELQGDKREILRPLLAKKGYLVKG